MPDDEVERLEPHESDEPTNGAPSVTDAPPDQAAAAEKTAESDGARGRFRVVGLVIGIVLMVAAIGFAVSIVVFGSSSPTDVVQELFESLEQEDVAGLAASLAPSEHRLILEPALGLVEEAERLGLLADTDPSAVSGIDLEFSNLVFESEVLAEDLVWVSIRGDAASTISTDELPIGPLLARYLPDDWKDDINTERETVSFSDVAGLAVVKEDGEWYVSLTYSIAEAARRESGAEFPQTQPFAEPAGASTMSGCSRSTASRTASVRMESPVR